VMRINVFGPMRLIAAIASRMANPGAIAVISSRMGSIGGMGDGGYALYRASKAAVNAVTRAASLEFAADGLTVLALHPGWVKTDMGGADADIDVATSVSGMRRLIDQASARESGRFFDYTGTELSW
nr:SDR family NAD(P)-dependent oxidoreductase [Betaproteobacteria bacterium]